MALFQAEERGVLLEEAKPAPLGARDHGLGVCQLQVIIGNATHIRDEESEHLFHEPDARPGDGSREQAVHPAIRAGGRGLAPAGPGR